MSEERPLLDTILEMTATSVSHTSLDDPDLMMVRLAALAASEAPPASVYSTCRRPLMRA